MQEVIVNVLFIAVLVVLAGTLFFDVRKKRNRMKTAEREGVELAADLNSKLPEGYVVLKDLYILTKLGRSRIDYVIVSPQGIFALEYRELYVYINADEEGSRWTFAPGIKGKHSRVRSISRRFIFIASRSLSATNPALSPIPWSRSLRLPRSNSKTQATNASLAWSLRSSPSSKNGRASHA